MTTATITLTVNITASGMKEGRVEFTMTIKEKYLPYIDQEKLAGELATLFEKARADYYRKNEDQS